MIRNSKQVTQAISFEGLQNKKIHPTDVDILLEVDNKFIIIGEVKKINNDIPFGQKKALERIIKRWEYGNYILLKIVHDFNNDNSDIPASICKVEKYYYKEKWYDIKPEFKNKTLVEIINKLANHWNHDKLKLSSN
tara:strand:+ start:1009 stop:1416 length:408 start_codon:yes stop_codon:yes gene_type:complete